ncbi:glucose 1-dehydrogenase [Leptolyngbya sp. FACHB-711]|uniref:glucose 1-dehydrogenase n=1 Tax=unclassified Leptolyngbya TaxID=2650499 RepID=UPI001683D5EB|nr:glucose 1-dehydrogenase [Leptolyngbya sp. FACHB-711]MBD1851753.1 glucose 1-dehydrogenase [Cyanobacteria bacterium FACHB-502]MBD2025631.1 glucose 1-dehydrogenase [Leptolyngbya sp. FACHB-711]
MSGRMDGKVVIVTGGSSGIGRATAIAFAREGAKVVIAARRVNEGEATVKQIVEAGGEAIFVQTDVTQAKEVQALVDRTLEKYGRLDAAFNNAGSGKGIRLIDLTEDEWEQEITVNLKSVWLCLKYQIPAMLKSGKGAIVNIASQGAILGVPNYSAYGAAKGGAAALTRAAAAEYAAEGIRINAVSPGAVETELWANAPAGMLEQVAAGIPMQRVGQPQDIAETVVWLCSDAAGFITGQNIAIDGGYTTSN